jgi:hypothetical protein
MHELYECCLTWWFVSDIFDGEFVFKHCAAGTLKLFFKSAGSRLFRVQNVVVYYFFSSVFSAVLFVCHGETIALAFTFVTKEVQKHAEMGFRHCLG